MKQLLTLSSVLLSAFLFISPAMAQTVPNTVYSARVTKTMQISVYGSPAKPRFLIRANRSSNGTVTENHTLVGTLTDEIDKDCIDTLKLLNLHSMNGLSNVLIKFTADEVRLDQVGGGPVNYTYTDASITACHLITK